MSILKRLVGEYSSCYFLLKKSAADDIDPIVELALAHPTKHTNVPAGFELVGSFHMCVGNEHYQLWARRRAENTECLRPITDVQFIAASQQEHVPLGSCSLIILNHVFE